MKVLYSPIDLPTLRKLAAEGKNDRELGVIFECSPQVIFQRRRDNGIPAGKPQYKNIVIDIERVRELAGKGMSDRVIGLELGCSEKTIRYRRHENGIEAGQPHKRGGGLVRDFAKELAGDEDILSVTKADAKFARLMAGRTFTNVRLRQSGGSVFRPASRPDDQSYTGCAAGMCVV